MKPRTVSYVMAPRRRDASAQIPLIRLRGRWLGALGFRTGGRYTLRVQSGALILTPTDETAA